MKSIKDMITDKPQDSANNMNEFLLAGVVLASLCLYTPVMGGLSYMLSKLPKSSESSSDKDDSEKKPGFFKRAIGGFGLFLGSLFGLTSSKDGDDNNEKNSNPAATLNVVAEKSIAQINDPVQKQQMQSQLNVIRASQVDENGNQRSEEDASKWLQDNLTEEDLKALKENAESNTANVEIDDKFKKEIKTAVGGVTEEQIDNELKTSAEQYKTIGKQIEEDAKTRKKMEEGIKKLEEDKSSKMEGYDKIISDAADDPDALKKATFTKAQFIHDNDMKILEARKQLNEFTSTCESSKHLNGSIPGREERLKKQSEEINNQIQKSKDDFKKACEAAGVEPPKETEPKETEPKETEPKETEPKETEPKETEPKSEEIKGVDSDGDPDGSVYKKEVDKDGNVKYTMTDKDGETIDIDEKDFVQAKSDVEGYEDETNGDDEKTGDAKTEDDDKEGEGENGKKVIKNPSKIWHKKKNKNTGKLTKSYYNKSGESISADDYAAKLKHYKEKLQSKNESFASYLKFHDPDKSIYNTIRESLLD